MTERYLPTGAAPVLATRSAPVGASEHDGAAPEVTDRRSRPRLGEKVSEIALAAVLAVVSALFMVTCHRVTHDIAGVQVLTGLAAGMLMQFACCVLLLTTTGRRFGLVVLAVVWALVVLPFAGQGAGGSVLMPAALAGDTQLRSWAAQISGVLIPCLVLVVLWIGRMRTLVRARSSR